MDEYQNRRDIDKIYDDLYDQINGSLNVLTFMENSPYKNVASKEDGSDRGTIDAIIDYYGLTNQYAPLIHNHTWNDIEDKPSINSYAISSDEYNPLIDSSVTITITVTDEYDETVPNHSFTLDANGTDVSLTTDDDGVATHTYTCDDWGLHTFKVKDNSIQINVKGYRTESLTGITLYYNDHEVNAVINHTQNVLSCTDTEWMGTTIGTVPASLRPKMHQFSTVLDRRIRVRVNLNGAVQYQSTTYLTNQPLQCNLCWNI